KVSAKSPLSAAEMARTASLDRSVGVSRRDGTLRGSSFLTLLVTGLPRGWEDLESAPGRAAAAGATPPAPARFLDSHKRYYGISSDTPGLARKIAGFFHVRIAG